MFLKPKYLLKKEGWEHNLFALRGKKTGVSFRIVSVYKQRVSITVKKGRALAAEGHGFLDQFFVLLVDSATNSTIMRELPKFKAQFKNQGVQK